MRVGVTEADPFVLLSGDEPAGGIEVALVESFAAGIDADIKWFPGSEEELLSALEVRQLDLVIGGLTSTSPWASKVTFTHPYLTTFTGIGVPEADQIGEDVAGLEVAAEAGTDIAGLLSETDAEVVMVDDLRSAEGAAATHSWLFEDLGLHDSDVRLAETDHVMAVPHGENAWLVALERFLLDRPGEIDDLLDQEGTL
jgi:polar amino acid transport system substrate-binding protein